ncbi:MAG: UxaA family hydrolase, partial [Verrucomicrobiales bacterium]
MNPPPAAIKIDPADNAAVALRRLEADSRVEIDGVSYLLSSTVAAKHKFACEKLAPGDPVRMYGVLVGGATREIARGEPLTTENLTHQATDFAPAKCAPSPWSAPDVSTWRARSFAGYHRADGSVGTANLWLVIPLVFCENRNVALMGQAMQRALGYHRGSACESYAASLAHALREGADPEALPEFSFQETPSLSRPLFENVDGLRVLTHGLGCGGTREDARALCGLLAGYVTHPNVAGAT